MTTETVNVHKSMLFSQYRSTILEILKYNFSEAGFDYTISHLDMIAEYYTTENGYVSMAQMRSDSFESYLVKL